MKKLFIFITALLAVLAIFYRDYRYSNNLLRLGVIESGLEKVQSQSGDFHVRLERLNQ